MGWAMSGKQKGAIEQNGEKEINWNSNYTAHSRHKCNFTHNPGGFMYSVH